MQYLLLFVLIANLYNVQSKSVRNKLILLDSFTEYLSGHIKEYCAINDIEVIETVSSYLQLALSAQGKVIPDSLKCPNEGEEIEWAIDNNIIESDDDNDYKRNAMIFSESDAGICTAERIQVALGLRGNGLCPHIRNKYLLNERARSRGLQVRSLLTNNSTVYHHQSSLTLICIGC